MDREDLLQFSFLTFIIGFVVLLIVLTIRSAVNFSTETNQPQSVVTSDKYSVEEDDSAVQQQAIMGATIAAVIAGEE